jgi:chemotaxis protein MotB
LFDSGRAKLKPTAEATLQKVVADIRQTYADKMILVIGHTDTDPLVRTKGVWEDNLDLSANRGMTVFREMQKLGLDPKRMIAGGQGEYSPRTSNETKEGKSQNRRVQIVAVPMPGAVTGEASAEPSATPSEAPTRRAIEK